MAVSDDYVRGERLDVILNLLEEETLDGLFNDDITTAVEELTSENKSGEMVNLVKSSQTDLHENNCYPEALGKQFFSTNFV